MLRFWVLKLTSGLGGSVFPSSTLQESPFPYSSIHGNLKPNGKYLQRAFSGLESCQVLPFINLFFYWQSTHDPSNVSMRPTETKKTAWRLYGPASCLFVLVSWLWRPCDQSTLPSHHDFPAMKNCTPLQGSAAQNTPSLPSAALSAFSPKQQEKEGMNMFTLVSEQ